MAKRDTKTVTLGSGKIYLAEFDGEMPTHTELCVEGNLLGYVKNGAELTYTMEPFTEKDDLGFVSKTIVTNEEARLKCGIMTWNGTTLQKLVDRATVTEGSGIRTTKIGGAGNAQGKSYAICFAFEDKADGNAWLLLKGTNAAGLTMTFAVDASTVLEPEFLAEPHDDAGTLIEFIEETTAA